MRQFILSTVVVLLPPISAAVYADGLIYQLPEDGASVVYKTEMDMGRNGNSMTSEGTLSVSSVGQATVDDEKCRWIEFKMEMMMGGRERTIISKVLIPEKHLKKGQTPIDHVKKCWLQDGGGEARDLEDAKGQRGGPLPVFLAGPLTDVKKLKEEVIETKLGELTCDISTGLLKVKQGEDDLEAVLETGMHDKAPFGVAKCKISLKINRDGQTRQTITMKLTMADVGKNAKSDLPDAN